MRRRLRSLVRTALKLWLLVLAYLWVGAAYKLLYAQTHDLARFKSALPISHYQKEFLVEALLRQTWPFGPAFSAYIGRAPSVAALASSNPQTALADYLREREATLATLPDRYPLSLFSQEALEDGYAMSQLAALLALQGGREEPRRMLAVTRMRGGWRLHGLPDLSRAPTLARRLADEYPESPQAPLALLRVAQAEQQAGREEAAREAYRRLALEYPGAAEAEEAASALYEAARAEGKLEEAREYRRRALAIAESVARTRFPKSTLPARNTLTLLGFNVDLAALEVQLARLAAARNLLEVAGAQAAQVQRAAEKDPLLAPQLSERTARLERVRSELWVAEAFEKLQVGVPGPPPRPREFPVSGRVQFRGQPFPGAEVMLLEEDEARDTLPAGDLGMRLLGALSEVRLRATTDRRGMYTIGAVPAGEYRLAVLAPARVNGVPVIPVDPPAHILARAAVVRVVSGPVRLPAVEYAAAVSTRTYGELRATDGAIRLEWNAVPGAAAYRVAVLNFENRDAFRLRLESADRPAMRFRPVLWQADAVRDPAVNVPLLALAPDNPMFARFATYVYEVVALDARGEEVARSALPLCRFQLSGQAFRALQALRPPGSGPFRRRRQEQSPQ